MSIVKNFNGKRVVEPGVYAQTKSGIPLKSSNFPFGDVMIIDTGSNAGWGGGSGSNGEIANGLDAVYSFEDANSMRAFLGGGIIWDYIEYIFNPLNGAPAPEKVYYASAKTSTPAVIGFNLTNGAVDVKCRNEGTYGNGLLDEVLAVGYISINGATVVEANTLTLTMTDGDSDPVICNALVVPATPTLSGFNQLVVDTINGGTGTHGYTAKLKGIDIAIYSPAGTGADGNADTVAATGTVTLNDSSAFAGGVDGSKLIKGFGATVTAGVDDAAKYIFTFYQGTFNGQSPNGYYYGGLKKSETKPALLATSPEVANLSELIAWMETDYNFNKSFLLGDYSLAGGGALAVGDITSSINLAANGTETYNAADMDQLLVDIKELGNTFFLCDDYGADAESVNNLKILDYILNESDFDKFMIVGGGADETKFSGDAESSVNIAQSYDSERVIVVHGGVRRADFVNGGEELLPAIYHAANVVGRLGGLEPQDPITFKALRIKNFAHQLGQKDRERALQAGVLHNRFVPGIGNVVNQGINTLQRNTQQINTDGTSFEISIMSIGAQLNKELILNLRPLFIGQNRGRVTKADVKSFVEGYLFSKTAEDNVDNLIIRFENVAVTLVEGDYDVQYGYVPNGPINKIFVTGFMLDTNL